MGDDRIKSAYELAMEKIEKIGEATEDEKQRWTLTPAGEKLALEYFEGEADLAAGFGEYTGSEKKLVAEGVQKVLLSHINLPKTDSAVADSEKALEGFSVIKKDEEGLHRILDGIGGLFNHYHQHGGQQRQAAVQDLKSEFMRRLQQQAREMAGGMEIAGGLQGIDPETMPQFQDEKRRLVAHLDLQYINHLDQYKRQLAELE